MVAITAVALVVVVLATTYVIQARRGESKAEAEAARLTQAVASGLSDQISRAAEVVSVVLADVRARAAAGQPAPISAEMEGLSREMPQLRAVMLVDSTGMVTAATARALNGRDFSATDWFRRLRDEPQGGTGLRLLPPQPGRVLEEASGPNPWRRWSIPVLTGVPGADNGMGGAALGLLNPDYLSAMAYGPANALGVDIRFYSFDGVLLARSDGRSDGIGGTPPNNWLFERFLPRRESGSFTGPDSTGQLVTASLAVSRQVPIVVEVAQRRDTVLEAAREQDRIFLFAGGMVTLIAGGALVLLLRQGQRLAESEARVLRASRAQEEFLAAMSHEIRTPMNGVINLSRFLLETGLGQVQRRYAETLKTSALHLMTVLDDILDFSRLSSGEIRLEETAFSPEAELTGIIELLVPRLENQPVELVASIDPGVPATVIGDPGRFRQILLNLVGNALKFTEAGWIRVNLAAAPEDEAGARHWRLSCAITDTGIGLDPKIIPMLFERFTQADASISRRYGGTGLGLAISRRLAEAMGGGVEASPRPAGGSVFRFNIRVNHAALPEPERGLSLPGRNVLVAGASVIGGKALREQLRVLGLASQDKPDTAAALAALEAAEERGQPFACVIIDADMPGQSAAVLARSIRRRDGLAPRIILYQSREGAGGPPPYGLYDAILLKPSLPERLREALSHAFGLHPLPVPRPEAPGAPNTPLLPAARDVLLVEDNEVNQFVLSTILEGAGIAVTLAGNGEEALARAAERPFDAIVMDMQMPVMDGLAATRAIRAGAGANRGTPIIGLSAAAGGSFERQCRDAGMDDYLSKPVDKAALIRALAPDGAARKRRQKHGTVPGPS